MADKESKRSTFPVQPKGGRPIIDRTGQRFGKLTALSFAGFKNDRGNALWLCICDCGKTTTVNSGKLAYGNTKSCGCSHWEATTTHHMSRTGEYRSWQAAKRRCYRTGDAAYPLYGGRGIRMYEGWRHNFAAFFKHIGKRPKGTSLDRIDNERGYEPGNVRWANQRQQGRNTRSTKFITYKGKRKSMVEWAEITAIPYGTIKRRRRRGMTPKEIFETPTRKDAGTKRKPYRRHS